MNYKYVFVIGLDGAIGWAVEKAFTPNIDEILSEGVVTYSARTVFPSSSFPAWGAMFHGVGPEKHKIDGNHPCLDNTPYPSFIKVLKNAYPWFKCASFCCWNPINTHIIEPSCRCYYTSMPDPELAKAAAKYIRKNLPNIFFIQLDYIDEIGHSYGYGSQEYFKQISITDRLIGIIFKAIYDSKILDESLIILLSDHGGVGKSHGSDHPDLSLIHI